MSVWFGVEEAGQSNDLPVLPKRSGMRPHSSPVVQLLLLSTILIYFVFSLNLASFASRILFLGSSLMFNHTVVNFITRKEPITEHESQNHNRLHTNQ